MESVLFLIFFGLAIGLLIRFRRADDRFLRQPFRPRKSARSGFDDQLDQALLKARKKEEARRDRH